MCRPTPAATPAGGRGSAPGPGAAAPVLAVGLGPDSRILFVGAGHGAASQVAAALAAGASVTVLDNSSTLLRRLESELAQQGGDRKSALIQYECTDVLRHEGKEYDAVVGTLFCNGLPRGSAESLLKHLCSLVKSGGAIYISDFPVQTNLLLSLAQRLLGLLCAALAWALAGRPMHSAPHDWSAWLPRDMHVEARLRPGRLRETTVARRFPDRGGPDAEVERLRRLYGGTSMAFCTSPGANRVGGPERGLRYFLLRAKDGEGCVGYVAYVESVVLWKRLRCVIMDPVCAEGALEDLLRAFHAECEAAAARPVYACVAESVTPLLGALGFHTTKLGSEVAIPLGAFNMPKERRRYLRVGPARGLECHATCYDLAELEQLNQAWVGNKQLADEAQIWTWPPSMPAEAAAGEQDDASERPAADEVRRLFTYHDGQLVGFVCAEPYHRPDGSGRVLGYGLNTIRFLPNAGPAWASDFTIATLVESLRGETDAEFLAFGISPYTELAEHPTDHAFLRGCFEYMWDAGLNSFYRFYGLAKKKAHHCAGQGVRLESRFVCGPRASAVSDYARLTALMVGDGAHRIPGELLGMASRSASNLLWMAASLPIRTAQAVRLCRGQSKRPAGSARDPRSAPPELGVGTYPNVEKAEGATLGFLVVVAAAVLLPLRHLLL